MQWNQLFLRFHLLLSRFQQTGFQLISSKKYRLFFISMLMCISYHADSQDNTMAAITTWYQNKPGAVSISFDDASYTQYTSAYPILEKYNIKGTFSVVGEWVDEQPAYTAEPGSFEIRKMGWTQLLELFVHGHELAAHGYRHERYNKNAAVTDLELDMLQIKSLIESRTDHNVFTLNYPYSYASGNIPLAAAKSGYLFGRSGLDTINPPSPPDMYLLATNAILNSEQPDSLEFQAWLDQANANWLILMYHHFFSLDSKEMEIIRLHGVENSYSVTSENFEAQVKDLAASGYWIAPISEVGKYIIERDNTAVRIIETRKKIYIYTITNLDKNLYDRPLTLEVELSWKQVKIEGSLCDGIFKTHDGKLYLDVLPETEIILTKD
jgi:peptidoglycan/xylan/chitin deacetylase (PgdA/CDA1 family)